ncbi:hypothetical protein [Pseudomonas amygdali]|nr:hypothetical protein [Pseudomonas amygdali]
MQSERHGDAKFANEMLFDGPLESHAALFFMAGYMGLIPMRENKGVDGAPVLYAVTEPLEGAQMQNLKQPEEFVLAVGYLLTVKKLRQPLMNSLLEFHDFLKLVDPPQAQRFIGDLVKALFQRTGDLSPLLVAAADDEDMGLTEDYPGTLRRAMEAHDVFDKAINKLKPSEANRALLRFGWQELRIKASQKGRDASLAQDLGL